MDGVSCLHGTHAARTRAEGRATWWKLDIVLLDVWLKMSNCLEPESRPDVSMHEGSETAWKRDARMGLLQLECHIVQSLIWYISSLYTSVVSCYLSSPLLLIHIARWYATAGSVVSRSEEAQRGGHNYCHGLLASQNDNGPS